MGLQPLPIGRRQATLASSAVIAVVPTLLALLLHLIELLLLVRSEKSAYLRIGFGAHLLELRPVVFART